MLTLTVEATTVVTYIFFPREGIPKYFSKNGSTSDNLDSEKLDKDTGNIFG